MADETARIRSDIEQTRQELGQTAEALATELDPRTRFQRLLDRVRQDPRPLAGVGAAVLLLLVLRRRR